MAAYIDLNADLGEGYEHDAELLSIVSSCNVACGGHAGDESSMATTVELALARGVSIGAHPSYPDRGGFGRRSRFLIDASLQPSLVAQISDLRVISSERGATLTHVKPHGALYNDAVVDSDLAVIVAAAIAEAAPGTAIVGLPDSQLEAAARAHDIAFVAEAFVDRAYGDDGQLLPRGEPGAVLATHAQVVAQCLSLAIEQSVATRSGRRVEAAAETLCIHGDTPDAASIARAIRLALEQHGVEIRAIRR